MFSEESNANLSLVSGSSSAKTLGMDIIGIAQHNSVKSQSKVSNYLLNSLKASGPRPDSIDQSLARLAGQRSSTEMEEHPILVLPGLKMLKQFVGRI